MRKHYPPLALLLAHSKQFSGHSRKERDLLSKLEMRKKIPIISTYKQLFASSDYLRKSFVSSDRSAPYSLGKLPYNT